MYWLAHLVEQQCNNMKVVGMNPHLAYDILILFFQIFFSWIKEAFLCSKKIVRFVYFKICILSICIWRCCRRRTM